MLRNLLLLGNSTFVWAHYILSTSLDFELSDPELGVSERSNGTEVPWGTARVFFKNLIIGSFSQC